MELKFKSDYIHENYNNVNFTISYDIKNLLQLGTYNGVDIFNTICSKLQNSKIILVEANKMHNNDIINNYSHIYPKNKVIIINKAIVLNEYSDKYVEFYLNNQCSSIIKPEDYSKIIRVETIKFNDILEEYNLYNLELLMIDLEGLDYNLLMEIDFNLIPKLKYIFFEGCHIDDKERSIDVKTFLPTFGKKSKLLIDKLVKYNFILKILDPGFYDIIFEKVEINRDNYTDYLIDTKIIDYYKNSQNNVNNFIFYQMTKFKTYYNFKIIEKYSFNKS